YPARPLRVRKFGESFAANETSFRSRCRGHKFTPRPNTSARYLQRQTSIHLRRHDEAQTRRRAGAVTGWKMGGVRCGRCRSRGQHKDLAFMDRAGERWRITAPKPDSEP